MFNNVVVNEQVEQTRREGVAFGLLLPADLVEEIHQYALRTPCIDHRLDRKFLITEVKNGRLPHGYEVTYGWVCNIRDCKSIVKVIQDPVLMQIAYKYLHYLPTRVTAHLTWSLRSFLSDDEIKQRYSSTNFHYDIVGYNSLTACFYITDVDAESGPHVAIRGSHKKKPLHALYSSGRKTDDFIFNYYGKENEIQIEGNRGFGFVEDPYCFHKLKPPVTRNRLVLLIRYS